MSLRSLWRRLRKIENSLSGNDALQCQGRRLVIADKTSSQAVAERCAAIARQNRWRGEVSEVDAAQIGEAIAQEEGTLHSVRKNPPQI